MRQSDLLRRTIELVRATIKEKHKKNFIKEEQGK
jgi:hypothetical protein